MFLIAEATGLSVTLFLATGHWTIIADAKFGMHRLLTMQQVQRPSQREPSSRERV